MHRFVEMPDNFVLGEFSEDFRFLCLLNIPTNIETYHTSNFRQYKQYVAGEAGILIRRVGHCEPGKTQRLYDRFAQRRPSKK